MGSIHLDVSSFPIVVTEMIGNLDVGQAEAYCRELEALGARGEKVGAITDLRRAELPSLKVRGVLRKFSEEHQPISDRTTVCSAIVVDNAVVQMAVSAIFLVVRTAYPQKVFRRMEDAHAWVLEQLKKAA